MENKRAGAAAAAAEEAEEAEEEEGVNELLMPGSAHNAAHVSWLPPPPAPSFL